MYRVGLDANEELVVAKPCLQSYRQQEKRDIGCEPKGDGLRGLGW